MSIYPRGTDPHEPLEAVLRAASAPGHPEELAGEQAAVAAFRTAVVAPRKRSFLARMLTVKVLIVGGVAVSTGVVLAAVDGTLPIPGLEPGSTPPSVTNPASVPTETPQDGPTSTPDEQPERWTPPPSTGGEHDRPDDDHSGPGKKKDDKHKGDQPQPGPMPNDRDAPDAPDDPTTNDPATDDSSSGRTQTPDSPAQGAVTAVPPNGAEPPSPGG